MGLEMTRLFLGWLLSCAIAFSAQAALKEGDSAPDFKAPASLAGKTFTFSLKEALGKGPVVVYFYPAAFTDSCNIQAHQFAANHEKFVAAGAMVVGVSLDSIGRLNAFSAEPDYCGGKVAVASDADGSIAKQYDLQVQEPPAGTTDTQGNVIEHGLVEQMTFVIAPDGKITAKINDASPTANVAKALQAVQRLADKQLTRTPDRLLRPDRKPDPSRLTALRRRRSRPRFPRPMPSGRSSGSSPARTSW